MSSTLQEKLYAEGIKARFSASLIANILRSLLAFVTGIVIARNLGPGSYGDYSFLIGSFIAVSKILEMGSSKAFFTFISQKRQPFDYVIYYLLWQGVQFITALVLISIIIPDNVFKLIWNDLDRNLVVFAFIATFFKNQVWQTILNIGESTRRTVIIKTIHLSISITHLVLIVILNILGLINIKILYLFITLEHVLSIFITFNILKVKNRFYPDRMSLLSIKNMIQDYIKYCSPLIVFSFLSFAYEFADRWLLQHFGGNVQQGFYSVGKKFSIISIVATKSLVKVFWKEIAEAFKKKNLRELKIYLKNPAVCCFSCQPL